MVRGSWGSSVTLAVALGCAPAAAPSIIEVPEPAPQVVAPEPSRMGWTKVLIAGERVCGIDERGIDWCWHAADLDAEPLAVRRLDTLTLVSTCRLGGPREQIFRFRPLFPPACTRFTTGEVDCSSGDSIQACSLYPSGQVYCQAQGAVARIEGVEDAAGLVLNDEAACAVSSEGRAWCWASGTTAAVELSVPVDEPSVELKLSFDRDTGLLEMHEALFAPLRLQLHDRFDPPFGPYELGFGIPELTLTPTNRA